MFAATPIRNTVSALAAAVVGTATLVALSASPAHAASAQTTVETQIAQQAAFAPVLSSNRPGVVTVAVRAGRDGRVLDASIAASSGEAAFDTEALRSASAVRYPQAARTRTFGVVLTFNGAVAPKATDSAALVSHYLANRAEALAGDATSPQG